MMGKNFDNAGHHLSFGTNFQETVTIYTIYINAELFIS